MKINELFYLNHGTWDDLDSPEIQEIIRMVRDNLLVKSDWTQLPDSPLTETRRGEWATYRQALRDILETNSTNLAETVFPTPPERT
jgi:hypothetical protein